MKVATTKQIREIVRTVADRYNTRIFTTWTNKRKTGDCNRSVCFGLWVTPAPVVVNDINRELKLRGLTSDVTTHQNDGSCYNAGLVYLRATCNIA